MGFVKVFSAKMSLKDVLISAHMLKTLRDGSVKILAKSVVLKHFG